jgi:histidinol-phosphate aminotransferase
MIKKENIWRPDWTIETIDKEIDLSKNVHYDRILNDKIKEIIQKKKFILNYGNDYPIYRAISNYYSLPIEKIAIGYGATDLIQRVINSLDVNKLYIVNPSFMMVDVYCKMRGLVHEFINLDQIKQENEKNSAIYICNPNGVNGEANEIKEYRDKFKWFIVDEVYSDFYNKYSVLNDISKNTIIIKSLSKSLGIAGLRVGFCCGNEELINEIQKLRMSQVTTSIASTVVPEIIKMTPDIISRMEKSKNFLQNKYSCKKSYANYVLFKEKNYYTEKFGAREINGYHRMALADLDTLNG